MSDFTELSLLEMPDEQRHELVTRLRALAQSTEEIDRLEGEENELRERLREIKAEIKEQQARRTTVCRDLREFATGQKFLPFDEHASDPDEPRGAERLTALGQVLAKSHHGRRASDLDALLDFGVSEKNVEALRSGLGVQSVGELAEKIAENPKWKAAGIGPKKKPSIEKAVQDYLEGPQSGAVSQAEIEDANDTRIRKCLTCGVERPQTIERCEECNDTTFELEEPTPDTDSESEIAEERITRTEIPCMDTTVEISTAQVPGGWVSSYFVEVSGVQFGSKKPHHNATALSSVESSRRHAMRMAAKKLFDEGFDDHSAQMRAAVDGPAKAEIEEASRELAEMQA